MDLSFTDPSQEAAYISRLLANGPAASLQNAVCCVKEGREDHSRVVQLLGGVWRTVLLTDYLLFWH